MLDAGYRMLVAGRLMLEFGSAFFIVSIQHLASICFSANRRIAMTASSIQCPALSPANRCYSLERPLKKIATLLFCNLRP
jgi:hypothetical protein